ncbi:unnamed protein product [Brassica oleracea]
MEKRGCGVGNVAISCVYLAIVLLLLSSALATSSQVTPPTTGYGGKWGVRTLMQYGEGDGEGDGLGCPDYCDLLDGSPVLGDLYICDDAYPYNSPCCSTIMMSKSIKRLVVFTHLPDSQVYHDAMLFSVPSLVYLDYSTFVFENHECVALDLLVEARLNLKLWEESTSHYDYSDDDDDDYIYDDQPKMPIFCDVTNKVSCGYNQHYDPLLVC